MEQHRKDLLQREREAASDMVRVYGASWQRIKAETDRLTAQMAAYGGGTLNQAMRLQRLQSLRSQIEAELRAFAKYASASTTAMQAEAIKAAQEHALDAIVAAGGPPSIAAGFDRVNTRAVEKAVGFASDGSPLQALYDEIGPDVAEKATTTIAKGIALGQSPRVTARQLRLDLGSGLYRALTIARTETLRSYRQATAEVYKAHDNIVEGWIWVASISRRTCGSCIAMHGSFHKLEETLDDHPNGRCAMAPKVKGRPSRIEPLGAEAFAKLSEEDQQHILGKGMQQAWKDGKVTLTPSGPRSIVSRTSNKQWGSMRRPHTLEDALDRDQAATQASANISAGVKAANAKKAQEAAKAAAEKAAEKAQQQAEDILHAEAEARAEKAQEQAADAKEKAAEAAKKAAADAAAKAQAEQAAKAAALKQKISEGVKAANAKKAAAKADAAAKQAAADAAAKKAADEAAKKAAEKQALHDKISAGVKAANAKKAAEKQAAAAQAAAVKAQQAAAAQAAADKAAMSAKISAAVKQANADKKAAQAAGYATAKEWKAAVKQQAAAQAKLQKTATAAQAKQATITPKLQTGPEVQIKLNVDVTYTTYKNQGSKYTYEEWTEHQTYKAIAAQHPGDPGVVPNPKVSHKAFVASGSTDSYNIWHNNQMAQHKLEMAIAHSGPAHDAAVAAQQALNAATAKAQAQAQARAANLNKHINSVAGQSYRTFPKDGEEANKWARQQPTFGQHGHITSDDMHGIKVYTGGSYSAINRHFRTGSPLDPSLQRAADHLDNALPKYEAPENLVLYRGERNDHLQQLVNSGNYTGVEYVNKAYVSSSFDYNVAKNFNGANIVLTIQTPKGTTCSYVDAVSTCSGEKEAIFPRGTKFRIEDAKRGKDDYGADKLFVTVTVVP